MSDFPGWYARTHSTPGHEVAMCCICFTSLTAETCAVDEHGDKWDVCKGQCAEESGLKQRRDDD